MPLRKILILAAVLGASAGVAAAQSYGLPPADVGRGGGYSNAQATDSANLQVRIDRLEEQVRQLTGQIEQAQFANKRLEDQLKKFQQDVDYRLQEGGRGGRPQKRSDAGDISPPPVVAQEPGVTPRSGRRSDAFNPSADPDAPGVPRALGGGSVGDPSAYGRPPQIPSGPIALDDDRDPNAPLDLSGGRLRGAASDTGGPAQGGPPPRAPRVIPLGPATASAEVTPGGTTFAGGGVATPKEEFDVALGYFKGRQYESAEKGFLAFVQKNPRNRLASDAYYYLGETYFQRGRQREAAEQYLKISTKYASSPRAPEAMLRLGESLQALGAKEQACATFSEVTRKYPKASAAIKSGAEREAKRAQC